MRIDSPAHRRISARRIGALSAVLALAAPLLLACSSSGGGGGGGGGWDTCAGYRRDVAPGSAQDTRDIRNGTNPCY